MTRAIRIVLAVGFVLLALPGVASAAGPTPLLVNSFARISGTWQANMRTAPSTSATFVMRVPKGQIVQVASGPVLGPADGRTETWYRARFRGQLGFLRGRYLVSTPLTGQALAAAALASGKHKYVVVSTGLQQAEFYEEGKLHWVFAVTTGRPELPTPIKLWAVRAKLSPYVMKSPWPVGDPYWYPTWTAKYAVRFDPYGDYLHDSYRRDSDFGYGTNVAHVTQGGSTSTGSHGCVNMPPWAIALVFPWITVGTPVNVTK